MTRVSVELLDMDYAAMTKQHVEDYPSVVAFPTSGEFSKSYCSTATNQLYRWNGSAYVLIGSGLVIGVTADTAYRGDRGKLAYDHSIAPHSPSDAEKNVQGDWTETNASADSFIVNKPATFTATAHIHDDRYYTEAEIDTQMATKADLTYTNTELGKKVNVIAYDAKIALVDAGILALQNGKVDKSVYDARVASIDSTIASINSTKADKSYVDSQDALKVDKTAYDATVLSINNTMTTLQSSKVAKVDYNAKVAELEADITDLQATKAEITAVDTALFTKVDKVTYNDKVAEIEADILALTGASATAAALTAGLALKVDKTTYNAKMTTLDTSISELGTTKATITYVDGEVAAVASDVTTLQSVKADKTYVNSQDALKVDKTAYNADKLVLEGSISNLGTVKADLTYVDTALTTKADLVGGIIPNSQLPSYVDDVKVYATRTAFPATGESDKVYVAEDNNSTYRWSGSSYVIIGSDLAIGETSSAAFRGDLGKIAYDHSQEPHSPADAEKNVQGDWTETDSLVDSFIKNKPATFTATPHNHDSQYFTETEVTDKLALKSDITYVDAAVLNLNTVKADLAYTNTELAKKVNVVAYDAKVATIETNVGALQSQKAAITYVDSQDALKVDQTDYDTMMGTVDASIQALQSTKSDKTYVDTKLATKVDKTTYDAKLLELDAEHTAINTNKADVTYVNTELAKKATIVYTDGLVANINTTKADLSFVNTELAKKVDKTTYDAKVVTLEADITGLGTTKADKTAVTTSLATKVDNTTYTSAVGVINNELARLDDVKLEKSVYDARLVVVNAALAALQGSTVTETEYNAAIAAIEADVDDLQTTKATIVYVDAQVAPKANTTYVDNADAQLDNKITVLANAKADKVYVDAQDALKVNITDNTVAMALKADLVDGLIPTSQLPGYVDDVLNFLSAASFPADGESGKIYVDESTNVTYRWSGSSYVKIGSDLALGETAATAYRGDRGAAAYAHSLAKTNVHEITKAMVLLGNVDNTSDALKPISVAAQQALDLKADLVNGQVPYEQMNDACKVMSRHEDVTLVAGNNIIPLTKFTLDAAHHNFSLFMDGVYVHDAVLCNALGEVMLEGEASHIRVESTFAQDLPCRVINIASNAINDIESIVDRALFQADRAQDIADHLAGTELMGKLDVIVYNTDKAALESDISDLDTTKATIVYVDSVASGKVDKTANATAMALKADLVGGLIPTNQLPAYVDDVLEFATLSAFPAEGETGKVYVDIATNKTYRWSGTVYVVIGTDLALGDTDQSAYRGDYGAAAYTHSQAAHAPVNAEMNVQSDWDATTGDAFILNKPATFTPSAHDHDEMYYTESEVDTALALKAGAAYVTTELGKKLATTVYNAKMTTLDASIASLGTDKADQLYVSTALSGKVDSSVYDARVTAVDASIADLDSTKADTTYVDAEVANLATSSYVNTKLALKADLVGGYIPTSQLPGYVDDVLTFSSLSVFPAEGEDGKIYVDTATNKTYRWSGASYVVIGSSLALGATSSTAYRGDHGAAAYTHSQAAHAPSTAEANVQTDWSAVSGAAMILNKPATFTATAHTHTPTEVGLGAIPNAISDLVTSASSSQVASSAAVKTAYDRGNAAYSLAGTKADSTHNHDAAYPGIADNETITGTWTFTKVVTSNVDFAISSDARLKDDCQVIENACDKFAQCSGYTYVRNDLDETIRRAGVIAQEIEAVLPEAVQDNEVTGFKTVNYNSIVAMLVNAVNELSARVKELESK